MEVKIRTKDKPQKILKLIILSIIGILVILGIGLNFSGKSSEPNEFGENYTVDNIMACIMSQQFVEPQLKSPGSARFQSCGGKSKVLVEYEGNQTYSVIGYVDSQNSYGALLRSVYYIQMKQVGEFWFAEKISIE